MTNWRKYKITSKDTYTRYIRFHLDGYVGYNNGSESRVDCENRTPFDGLGVGDMIEIDADRVCNYNSGHEFPDTSIVRQSQEITLFNRSESSIIPSSIRQSFLSNISDAYQSGDDFQAFVEQRDRTGRTNFQWYGGSKDGEFNQGSFYRKK